MQMAKGISMARIAAAAACLLLPTPAWAARDARVTGAVLMKVTVTEAGGVAAVKALCGPPQLIQSAAEAVSQARCEPLATGGKAVPFTGVVIYRYTLQ